MTMKKILPVLLITGAVALTTPSCKSKVSDADVKTKVEAVITPGITADVKDGVVTLSGTVSNDAEKAAAETAVKALDAKSGVKSVVNNITVQAPPPPPVVTTSPDDALTAQVKDAIKDFPGINAEVKDGIITVTGELSKAKVKVLKMALDHLNPKKTDMSALKVK